MSQLVTKFIQNLAVTAPKISSGAATSVQPLFSDGSGGVAFRSIVSGDLPSLSTIYVTQSEVGAANGVASLDGSGKVPLSQLPATLMEFKGNWDPTTNTPTLVDGTGTTGFTYWVSAVFAGPVTGLNDPSMVNFQIGDLVIYNGTTWVLVTPAAGVTSVNGAQGAVTVNAINQLTGDVTAGPASGSQSVITTLATVNSNVGSFTLSSITVNAKGLITAASSASTTGSGAVVLATSPTLVTPALGTPSALVGTNITGTAAGLTAGHVTTNANLTGDVTSVGNATTLVATTNSTITTLSALSLPYSQITGAPAGSFNNKETFVLSGTDITNQFVTLAHTPISNSTSLSVQGGGDQLEGTSYDYTVSGATIVFRNGLATGGVSALVAGDVLQVQYEF